MGMGVPMEADDEDESSLLAELAALEGKPQPAKKGKPKKGKYYIKVKTFTIILFVLLILNFFREIVTYCL